MDWQSQQYLIFGAIICLLLLFLVIYVVIIKRMIAKKLKLKNEILAISSGMNKLSKEYENIKSEIDNGSEVLSEIKKQNHIATIENDKIKSELEINKEQYLKAQEVFNSFEQNSLRLKEINEKLYSLADREKEADEKIFRIKEILDLYERLEDFERNGLFENPDYLFSTSEKYVEEIKKVRMLQKQMIANDEVIEVEFLYEDLGRHFENACNGQKRLMIRSFNIECDFLISKVNPANFERTMKRIGIIADTLESDIKVVLFLFNKKYIELKCQECLYQYQYKLKKKEEQEEQRALREQMREEEKARKEYERAIIDAKNEEDKYEILLKDAKKSMEQASQEEKEKLLYHIKVLEEELEEAKRKGERAKSMAEQTRKGYVYIISNIGSFGEDVVKIGLTRRIDPTERVRELGDASVPFSFDIHAMIASDDAPALEHALHLAFSDKRVNAVNMRKEFFRVTLDEIRIKAQEITGNDNDFIMTIAAEEYYQTRRLRNNYVPQK